MKIDLYNVVYIITNVLFSYTIFKFIRIFFNEHITNKAIEIITYICYFLISICVYAFFKIPVMLMATNIILFFLLTLNYTATMKKRIICVALMYLTFMCIEMSVVLVMGYIDFPLFKHSVFSSTLGIVLIRCFSFMVVLVMSGFKNIKSGINIPNVYWLSILLVPTSSIVIMVILFEKGKLHSNVLFVCVTLLMLINITTFYLYDKIIISAENKTKMLLSLQQNAYYEKQLELMKASMTEIKILRHDLKNQLSAIQSIAKTGDVQALNNHIETLIGTRELTKPFANSGNVNIDSILNFKIFEAEQAGIQTSLLLSIPETIEISSVDLCTVLGNLIDNAVQAAGKLDKENRKMSLAMRYDKKRIIITISNTFNGKIIYDGDKIVSSHENKIEHGLGLLSVKNTVERCDGIMDIEHTTDTFTATVIIPV